MNSGDQHSRLPLAWEESHPDSFVVIVDFGSQYTKLLARRFRALGVYTEIIGSQEALAQAIKRGASGIVFSGGPGTVSEVDHPWVALAVASALPILGICYGMQLLADYFGGQVRQNMASEYGMTFLNRPQDEALLFNDVPLKHWEVWMSHGDDVATLPSDFVCLASSNTGVIAAMAHVDKPYYGLQFHPEVTHSQKGQTILSNFAKKICLCACNYAVDQTLAQEIGHWRDVLNEESAKDQSILLGISGGVDSAVCAALLHKAVGDRLVGVFVDTGLLRLGESEQVKDDLETLGIKIVIVKAKDLFLSRLKGVKDPEEKRKAIGRAFIEVFESYANQNKGQFGFLAQGTIYPDVIESAGIAGKAKVIKSHHNVGGLPDRLALKLVEPLRMRFKDEVREMGALLGLSDTFLKRHPFPGPGLGIRVLGEVDEASLQKVARADSIWLSILRQAGWMDRLAQAFCVLLPVKSVGVAGDSRIYEPVIALRAVQTEDFMTARAADLPFSLLEQAATQILAEVSGVSRVVLDLTSKPPGTIEWE